MKNLFATVFLTLAVVIPSAYALAAPQGTDAGNAAARVAERIFSEAERAVIEEYFRARTPEASRKDRRDREAKDGKGKGREGLPPGLARKDQLPPGLEKQLQKNGTLPRGLARNELPVSLQNKLYPPKKGTRRILVGRDVVLIDSKTDLILDVIHDVIRTSTR
jgi:Ni/Co efflux regulator RcnB